MEMISLTRILLPVLVAVFVIAALAYPLVRLYRQFGVLGLVLQGRDRPVERAVSVWTMLLLLILPLWVGMYSVLGVNMPGLWLVSPAAAIAGMTLIAMSIGLVVVAQAQMGASWRIGIEKTSTALVQRGLFGYVRHPIYTGVFGMVVGLVMTTPSPWTIAGLILTAVLLTIQARLEESHLEQTHADAYRRYASATGRFLPGLGKVGAV